jgi:hypothetical protein
MEPLVAEGDANAVQLATIGVHADANRRKVKIAPEVAVDKTMAIVPKSRTRDALPRRKKPKNDSGTTSVEQLKRAPKH